MSETKEKIQGEKPKNEEQSTTQKEQATNFKTIRKNEYSESDERNAMIQYAFDI